MSFPNIPDITPTITIGSEQCVSMLLASIALEELGQAHIMNAEAEKLQYVLGTLRGSTPPAPPTIAQLLKVNDSICMTLRNVVKNQMLLGFKLEDTIHLYNWHVFLNIATVTAEYNGQTVTASDRAYYHTNGGAA